MTIQELMAITFKVGASDLHLVVGSMPTVRVHGVLKTVPNAMILDAQMVQELVFALLSEDQKNRLVKYRELDFSVTAPGVGRFRANAYCQKQSLALALRSISEKIPSIDSLKLAAVCHQFAKLRQGFVLVTGPTGHGKSSTIASVLE